VVFAPVCPQALVLGAQGSLLAGRLGAHEEIEGVAVLLHLDFPGGAGFQLGHLPLDFLQEFQGDLPPALQPGEADVTEGVDVGQDLAHDLGDAFHLRDAHPALGDPGGAKAQPGGVGGVLVAVDGVLVHGDAAHVQDAGGDFAGEGVAGGRLDAAQVDQAHVGVGAAVGQLKALPAKGLGQGGGVLHNPLLQLAEGLGLGQFEADGLGGDDVDVRPALFAGEDAHLDSLGQVGVGGQDAGPARPAEGLVGGEGDHVGVADGGGEDAGRHQTGGVGDVGHEDGPDLVGDSAEGGPVHAPGIGAVAGDDEAGAVLQGQFADLVIVESAGGRVGLIGDHPVEAAGAVDRAAVGEVAAVGERHAHDHVARLAEGVVDGVVGGGAGEGLDVGVDVLGRHLGRGKGLGAALHGQRLDKVHQFRALVVAPVGVAAVIGQFLLEVEDFVAFKAGHPQGGVAFGVDVVVDGGEGLPHGAGGDALGGDHDEFALLAFLLQPDEEIQVGIQGGQVFLKEEQVASDFGHLATPLSARHVLPRTCPQGNSCRYRCRPVL